MRQRDDHGAPTARESESEREPVREPEREREKERPRCSHDKREGRERGG
jgi:hypothetical protein